MDTPMNTRVPEELVFPPPTRYTLTKKQAAKYAGVSTRTILRWVEKGWISNAHDGRGLAYYDPKELYRILVRLPSVPTPKEEPS